MVRTLRFTYDSDILSAPSFDFDLDFNFVLDGFVSLGLEKRWFGRWRQFDFIVNVLIYISVIIRKKKKF